MEQDNNRSDDREIEAVLARASAPQLPEGSAARLMARIALEPQEQLPPTRATPAARPAAPRRGIWRLAAAVPLAASLALGIWLGANGRMDFMLPTAVTGGVALNDDTPVDDLGGVGDAYAEEGTT